MKNNMIRRLCAVILSAALLATSAYTAPVQAADDAPMPRVAVHDPSILKADGNYYLFGSHLADAKSTDLIHWTQMNPDWNFRGGDSWKNDSVYGNILDNFAESFAWAGYDDGDVKDGALGVWAPDVIYNPYYEWEDSSKGAYMMYYSASSTWRRSCIGYAVSKTAEGPYQHIDTVIYTGFTKTGEIDHGLNGGRSERNTRWDNDYLNLSELIADGQISGISDNWFFADGGWNHNYAPNAIDPTIFFSKDNKMYMVYGSWSGGLFIHELDKATGAVKYPGVDGTETVSGNFTDRYFGTHIAGGNHQSGEGAYILYDEESDYYYLYETYGGLLHDGGYNMRLFRSKNVYGPYLDASGNNAKDSGRDNDRYGIKLIGNYAFSNQPGYRAAGHNSAMIDEDGQRYLFHHQRFDLPENQHEGHQVRVRRQYLNEDQWPVPAVYEYRGEEISHYDDIQVVGSYEVIDHGTATNGEMISSQKLDLCADGTIRGDMSGQWTKSAADGKEYDYITLTINGVIYKGFLYQQFNEETNEKTDEETNEKTDEETNEKTPPPKVMTFSAIGDNNTCLWGSQTTETAALSEALSYGFDFETPAVDGKLSPTEGSQNSGTAILKGTASIVADDVRSSVLQIKNSIKSLGVNYLQLPNDALSAVAENGFTVSMWVNIGTDTILQSALFEANAGGENYDSPMTRIGAGGVPQISANDSEIFGDSCDIPKNEWHHIAYSIDPNGVKLYLDGKLETSTNKDLSKCFDDSLPKCIQNAGNVCVGSGLFYGNEDVRDAKFDDIAIYSAALSSRQVAEIYESTFREEKPAPPPEEEDPSTPPDEKDPTTPPEGNPSVPPNNGGEKPSVNPPGQTTPAQKDLQVISVKSTINKTYGSKAFSLNAKLTKGNGALSYVSSNPQIASVSKNGKVTIKDTGTATITVAASETAAFKKKSVEVKIRIAPKKISLTTVKGKSPRKAVLTWKRASRASGYRIQYATNSKFKSARTITVPKVKTRTKTIARLKRKKTYYFRIQPYKKSGGVPVYGAYSKPKKLKVK